MVVSRQVEKTMMSRTRCGFGKSEYQIIRAGVRHKMRSVKMAAIEIVSRLHGST